MRRKEELARKMGSKSRTCHFRRCVSHDFKGGGEHCLDILDKNIETRVFFHSLGLSSTI